MLAGRKPNHRMGEKFALAVMTILNLLMIGPMKRYRSIQGEVVAKGMVGTALEDDSGIHIYPSDVIQQRGSPTI
jgi:hypothetical protein